MSIERINFYDGMRIAYVQDLATAKTEKANIFENELVWVITEAVLLTKVGDKLFKAQFEEVV